MVTSNPPSNLVALLDSPQIGSLTLGAVGLWVKARSWCQRTGQEWIRDRDARALKGNTKQINELLESGVWVRIDVGRYKVLAFS